MRKIHLCTDCRGDDCHSPDIQSQILNEWGICLFLIRQSLLYVLLERTKVHHLLCQCRFMIHPGRSLFWMLISFESAHFLLLCLRHWLLFLLLHFNLFCCAFSGFLSLCFLSLVPLRVFYYLPNLFIFTPTFTHCEQTSSFVTLCVSSWKDWCLFFFRDWFIVFFNIKWFYYFSST